MVLRIVLGIALGIVVGELFGARAEPLAQMGTVILDMIKGLAGPLLLFAILDAFLRTAVKGRSAWLMIGISLTNAAIAITIGLTLSNTLQPGRSFDLAGKAGSSTGQAEFQSMSRQVAPDRTIDFVKDLVGLLPTSILRPIVDNTIISIVILAVLGGLALRRVKLVQLARGESGFRPVEEGISTVYQAIEVILGWVIALVPLAVFGVVARTVGVHGFRSFRFVIPYVGVGVLGLLIQVLIVYQAWLILIARMPLRKFWSGAREPIATAIGTGSSLATLPVTLRSLDRMGVSPRSARMAACVGTNLNNDGILLYEAMAVLFVAQAIGVEMTVGQQVLAAASCVVAGIGISGVPDAGLISLLIVLKTVRLPEEAVNAVIPFLLSVDWVLGRCRSATNVTSDMLVAVLLDRLEPERLEDIPTRLDEARVDNADASTVLIDPREMDRERKVKVDGSASSRRGEETSDPDGI
jgi:Na+/H+-dicarboxylate symporter